MKSCCVLLLLLTFSVAQTAGYHGRGLGTDDRLIGLSVDEPVPFTTFFNDESEETIRLHLSVFALELEENKNDTGYIISYAGKIAKKNESECNLLNIKDFLRKNKEVDFSRYGFIDGGHRKKGMTELFLVPGGADNPKPAPSIPAEEVEYVEGECLRKEPRSNTKCT